MRYDNITRATFLKRPNRFIAEVDIYVDRNFASDQEMLMDVTGFDAKQLSDFREKFLEEKE